MFIFKRSKPAAKKIPLPTRKAKIVDVKPEKERKPVSPKKSTIRKSKVQEMPAEINNDVKNEEE